MATTTEELVKKTNTTNTTPQTEQINAMYDAQKQAQMSQLESAYNQNLSNAQAAKDKIAPQYQQSANDLSVQFERNRRNYNQQALANGMNTGTASQARLAQNNEYLRDFGQLRTAESNAMTEAERGITDLKTQYQSAIAAAAADNDYKRAAALLDEYNNQYSRDMNQAQLLAQYGDFSMYEKLYGKDTADKMASAWVASNPDLAYRTGQISAAQYAKMTGVYPAGYSPARSGSGSFDWRSAAPQWWKDLTHEERVAVQDGLGLQGDGFWGPNTKNATAGIDMEYIDAVKAELATQK